MKFVKEHWKFLLFIIISGLIGSYFTVVEQLKTIDSKLLEEAIKQVGSKELVIIISTFQTTLYYAVICGVFGMILCNKIGLWKEIKFEKEGLIKTGIIALTGGFVVSYADILVFGHFKPLLLDFYKDKPSLDYILSAFFYGGVIEEVMMRLFLMSLIAWILYKIFYKKEKKVPVKAFVIANIIAALLFALGHIPSTIQLFGKMDLVLWIRCLLLNGGFGLCFGWLYRKYGIHYSMLAHFGSHLISKIIWILFI